jgi:hypothetical protein
MAQLQADIKPKESYSPVAGQADLAQTMQKFDRQGGFSFLESAIDGVANLNPDRRARREIFLNDSEKSMERENLLKTLTLWLEVMESDGSLIDMITNCQNEVVQADAMLKKNLKEALATTRALETSYRTVAQFYKNTELDKVDNIVVLNASAEQLKDLDNPVFIDYVAEEFRQYYDRLDLRDNYSLLIIPGYLGSNKVVEKWAKIANENKVMMITDFANLNRPDDVIELFTSSNLTGGELHRSNVMMTCNYLIGRGKSEEVEAEDIYIGGASSLAGKVYGNPMSQVSSGKKYGAINELNAVRFSLKKSEISHLEKLGLVPMVYEYGKVMGFSAKTLFDGDNIGLQTYSVVRVFDYITKVLSDFLNRRAFENWDVKTETDLRQQIVAYLDSVKGPRKLIEKFKITRFERDRIQKDRIWLDIHLTPFFPAKSFIIKMDGHKGDDHDSAEWNTEYGQV